MRRNFLSPCWTTRYPDFPKFTDTAVTRGPMPDAASTGAGIRPFHFPSSSIRSLMALFKFSSLRLYSSHSSPVRRKSTVVPR